jgi:hypothetical protein
MPYDGSSKEAQELIKVDASSAPDKTVVVIGDYKEIFKMELLPKDLELASYQIGLLQQLQSNITEDMYKGLYTLPTSPKENPEYRRKVLVEIAKLPAPRTRAQDMIYGAIQLLRDPRRWIKGRLGDAHKMCFAGALYQANIKMGRQYDDPIIQRVLYRGGEIARQKFGHKYRHGVDFNDHPETTHSMLLDVMIDLYCEAGHDR